MTNSKGKRDIAVGVLLHMGLSIASWILSTIKKAFNSYLQI